ncbi:MAG: hypothetical protein U0353_02345 [Sandaracinus sp.]
MEQRLIGLLGAAGDMSSVSPEMLLALLQNRMRDMDGQINTIMLGLNERTQRAEQIGERLSEMRNVQTFLQPHTNSDGTVRMDDPIDQDGFYALCRAAGLSDDEARAAWAAATADGGLTVRLDRAIDTVMPATEGMPSVSSRLSTRQGCDNEIDNLNQDLQDCNRGNELLMIKMQTLMDQRKQCVELTSNMLNVNNQTLQIPLDHIGR